MPEGCRSFRVRAAWEGVRQARGALRELLERLPEADEGLKAAVSAAAATDER